MPRNHQVQDFEVQFEEFQVEAVLDRRDTAVNEAGPDVVSESEVEPDGDALLYCEALLSCEALVSDDADPAESTGSPAEESGPSAESAVLPAEDLRPLATGEVGRRIKTGNAVFLEGFRLLRSLLE
ncbi:hypothetical protein OUZ56_012428 [Daphnia magna]|uniref:Uncharacterized protein n=1 Tax=Daphnia magna TaxID=35525 RepID=A0ABQ9Z309_9CRUS|nr:hypothetical protein OUZ56_012428 [Daphnia magna]